MKNPFKKDWNSTWSISSQLCSMSIDTRLQCAQISQKIMTGIIASIRTSLLTTEDPPISIIIPQKSAKLTTQKLGWDATLNVNFRILHSKDCITLISIRLTPVSSSAIKRSHAKRVNFALLFTMNLSRGIFLLARCCSYLIDSDYLHPTFNSGS